MARIRKPSPEEIEQTRRERDSMARLLHLQANGRKANAIETYRDKDGCVYRYTLWGATDASGGLLVTVFKAPGQNVHLDVRYFEDARPSNTSAFPEYATAWYRLDLARTRACQAA